MTNIPSKHRAIIDMYKALKDAQEELRLIRMKDTNIVYDSMLKTNIILALAQIESEFEYLKAEDLV